MTEICSPAGELIEAVPCADKDNQTISRHRGETSAHFILKPVVLTCLETIMVLLLEWGVKSSSDIRSDVARDHCSLR
ncbi:hypothetical protein Tco_0998410 [Tanacetum coccineum]